MHAGPTAPVYDTFITHYAPPGPMSDPHRLSSAAELQPRGPTQPPARFPNAQCEVVSIAEPAACRVFSFRLGTCHPDLGTSVRANVEVVTNGSRGQMAEVVEQFCKSLGEYVEEEQGGQDFGQSCEKKPLLRL